MDETTYQTIFVARQPIFTAHNDTWGYLMLFRDSQDADRAVISDNSEATMNLVANLPLCRGLAGNRSRLLIHFTPEDVTAGTPLAVPSGNTVITLGERAAPPEALLQALRGLKSDGYEVAINNFLGSPGSEPLAEMADALLVDMTGKSASELAAIVGKGQKFGVSRMIAKCVENADDLERAREAGFTLFHGFFFKHPQTESGRKLASSEITRLKLFEIIEKDEPNFDALAPAIEADVAISYRLLNFLNSASFSFATTVTSIRQAVVLAGWKPIRNWLRLIILTDMAPSQKSLELSYLSAHRAKLFETAALGGGYEEESDKLFMLGLFSLLDALLDMRMEDIVRHLPVEDDIKSALCGENNRYAPWLALAKAIEQSDWDAVGTTAKTLDLLPGTVAVSYQHAFTWADSFFASESAD
ncbi:HDOD domain-containing protein [Pseudodesulfovibrio sp. F-1]|uniref:HDOD domain-containing protein n=1 Tax=Pseudodesulfovibrio alkaliphilus TaxID=2661613 RepID=A0A7K1KMQ9_9BACT|nr:HDOD domain-containing protein [Pseudodesulfovibrio alkaliphilus]MUM77330.1 HDOD domain-containing protein [Pseudodesulfovibrio alkaliphilus]